VSRVALATCEIQARSDSRDPDEALLLAALAEYSIDGEFLSWDDPAVEWNSWDLTVVRSTWDYTARRQAFVTWAQSLERLYNPAPVIHYSTDKHYLAHLAAHGVAIIDTEFVDVGTTPTWPDGTFVVKPTVGAGSMDAQRFDGSSIASAVTHVARLHDSGRDAMVQPYVDSVDDEGELALVYIDGTFSHALRKGAMLRTPESDRDLLFRVEQMSVTTADDEAIVFGDAVLAASGFRDLLYGRVDCVRTSAGWAVMELELVEPSLFLSYHPPAATALARGISRRVDRHQLR
jgi:hypothetical protein